MVFITLPPHLTEEEELLLQKFAKLKKKRKALTASKTPKPEKQDSLNETTKRPAEAATEQAKKLIKLGAIKVDHDRRDQHTFKRMKRSKDSEKQSIEFQPFTQSSVGGDDVDESRPEASHPKSKYNVYGNFVPSSDSKMGAGDPAHRRPTVPQHGNTVYVYGHGISEDVVRRAFAKIGGIVHINMDTNRKCSFVMFETMDLADQAVELSGCVISGVQLEISIARHQPNIDTVTSSVASATGTASDSPSDSWSTIAASTSQKASHPETREMVTYDEMF